MAHTSNTLPVGDWITKVILSTSVTIGTTPTPLPATALTDRRLIIVYNISGATVYVGNSLVRPGNGIPIGNGASLSLNLDAGVVLYGVENTGGREVRVFEAS